MPPVVHESPTVEVEGLPLGDVFETEQWKLEVLDGAQQGTILEMKKRVLRIGSDPLNDLVLTDRTVSRQHCELLHQAGQCKLVDLGSTNGTFLNELKVGEIYLSHGTIFRVGKTRVRFTVVLLAEPVVRPETDRYGDIIGSSPGLRDVFAIMDKVAPTDLSVVIEGETGTGKELIARAIHQNSRRADKSLVVFDCSAFPATLLESELFGHEKGAFSGATYTHRGVFERANGGTIFFDELAEMDVEFQPKFLRVLETGEFRRVGGERTLKVDVRVVAATNRKLDEMIAKGTFRRDLFYRLAKVRFRLPPLRERHEDIPLLIRHLLDQACKESNQTRPKVSGQAVALLLQHPWPGNIRQLENLVRGALLMSDGDIEAELIASLLPPSHHPQAFPATTQAATTPPRRLPRSRRRGRPMKCSPAQVMEAMDHFAGDRVQAAAHLGISTRTLQRYITALTEEL